jgi:YD repeat-containing protein
VSVSKVWNATAGQPEFTSTLTYEYDEAGRLAGVRSSSVNGTQVQYGYDLQNRLSEVFDPHSGRSLYHVESGRLVCTYPDGQSVLIPSAAHGSDNVGTVEVSEPGKTTTLVYDADGNLVLKSVVTESGITVTHYVVDPLNFTGVPQVVEELTSGVVTAVHTYGYHLISRDELVDGEWTLQFVLP